MCAISMFTTSLSFSKWSSLFADTTTVFTATHTSTTVLHLLYLTRLREHVSERSKPRPLLASVRRPWPRLTSRVLSVLRERPLDLTGSPWLTPASPTPPPAGSTSSASSPPPPRSWAALMASCLITSTTSVSTPRMVHLTGKQEKNIWFDWGLLLLKKILKC